MTISSITQTISQIPIPPNSQDSVNFNVRADDFLASLPTLTGELNSLKTQLNTFGLETNTIKDEINTNLTAVAAVANITKWISGTTYSEGQVVYSPTNYQTYRRSSSNPGSSTLDPSGDSTRWFLISASGDVTATGTQTLTNKTLTSPKITGLRQTVATTSGNSNISLSASLASVYILNLTGGANITITSSGLGSSDVVSCIVQITSNGNLVSWSSNIKWAFGLQPPLTPAGGTDVLGFYTYNGGTNWVGSVIARNIS